MHVERDVLVLTNPLIPVIISISIHCDHYCPLGFSMIPSQKTSPFSLLLAEEVEKLSSWGMTPLGLTVGWASADLESARILPSQAQVRHLYDEW